MFLLGKLLVLAESFQPPSNETHAGGFPLTSSLPAIQRSAAAPEPW